MQIKQRACAYPSNCNFNSLCKCIFFSLTPREYIQIRPFRETKKICSIDNLINGYPVFMLQRHLGMWVRSVNVQYLIILKSFDSHPHQKAKGIPYKFIEPIVNQKSGHCPRDCQKSMFVYGSSHIELIFEISLLCIYVTINLGCSPGILGSEYLRKQTGNGGFFLSLKKHRRKCFPRNCTHSNWIFIAKIQTANVANKNSIFRTFLLLESTCIP